MVLGGGLSLYTQASQRIPALLHGSPLIFFFLYELISEWFIALVQVNSVMQTVAEVFLPAVLCPLTTADYLYITATLPLSRPLVLFLSATAVYKAVVAAATRPTCERIQSVSAGFVWFFFERSQIYFWPARAQQRKVATAQKANSLQRLRSPFGEWLRRCYGYSQGFLTKGGFERCLCHKREMEKKKNAGKSLSSKGQRGCGEAIKRDNTMPPRGICCLCVTAASLPNR